MQQNGRCDMITFLWFSPPKWIHFYGSLTITMWASINLLDDASKWQMLHEWILMYFIFSAKMDEFFFLIKLPLTLNMWEVDATTRQLLSRVQTLSFVLSVKLISFPNVCSCSFSYFGRQNRSVLFFHVRFFFVIYICLCLCLYIYTHICAYTYIYMYMNIHIYI